MATHTPTPARARRAPVKAPPKAQDQAPANGLVYDYEIVALGDLMVDAYQRPLSSLVKEITSDFKPALVGVLCLSKRGNGKYAIIDGQTRAHAMGAIGLTHAPAIVYKTLTREQEAEMFADLQTRRRNMQAGDRFNAQVIAGLVQREINELIEDMGFKVKANIAEEGALRAVGALEFAYFGTFGRRNSNNREPHPDLLRLTLSTIREIWPDMPDTAKSSAMIKGMAVFLAREPGSEFKKPRTTEIKMDVLRTRLGKMTPSALAKRGEALRDGRGMSGNSPTYLAEAIHAQYSKR